MEKLRSPRERIVKALDYFHERGWIELRASGLVHGYRKLRPIDSPQELIEGLHANVEMREAGEIQRVRQALELAAANECQAGLLSAHFGQPMKEPCGHCSFCRGEGAREIPEPKAAEMDAGMLERIQCLVAEHPAALNAPRAIARFLCGIRSPALTRARLTSHASFGVCERIPFDSIMQLVETQIAFERVSSW